MSKAFLRESDDLSDEPISPRPSSLLPPGTKNYLTPDGDVRLRKELERMIADRRARPAASPDDDAYAKRERQVLDQHIFQLQQGLRSAEVVAPPDEKDGPVRFGATVTVRDRNGVPSRYRIVGVDETDTERGWVSWQAPVARALLNARLGERVRFKFPSGDTELEIVSIDYERIGPSGDR